MKILFGMKEICNYTGYGRRNLNYLIEKEGFPAVKIGGRWQSNSVLVEEWQLRLVRERSDLVSSGSEK